MSDYEEHKNDFSKGSVKRNILNLAVPMTVAQIINLLYNIVDRMYIGRMEGVGTLALGGVGLTLPIITFISAFANLFGLGGAPLCSMERGRGDDEKARRIMQCSYFMLLVSGILLAVSGWLLMKPMLFMFGASEQMYPYARDYLSIYLSGTVFVMISLGLNSYINSQGFGKTGMLTIVCGAVANIILDPIFIFVFDMGVKGAALATILSQLISAVWVLKFLTGKKAILKLKIRQLVFDSKIAAKIIGLGLSGFTMSVTNSLVQMVCNAALQQHGGDIYVSVMTVLNSIREVFSMPVQGITSGAQPVISYNYGAKAYDRVREGFRFLSYLGIAYTFLAWLLISLLPQVFIRLFSSDPQLLAPGVAAVHIYFFGFFMMALQFSGQAGFVALGKAKQAVFFSLFRKVIIVIPLTLILPKVGDIGVVGVFLAEPISNFIGGIACFSTFMLMIWPTLKVDKKQ